MSEPKSNNLEDRVQAFNEEFITLLAKYKLGLSATVFVLPDGRLAARPNIFDDTIPHGDEPKVDDLATV